MIQTYFGQIKKVVDRFTDLPFVLTLRVSFEVRPGDQGYIVGEVLFTDRSRLYFREYLDVVGSAIDKVMYVYHYQTQDAQLIFRYDNARHRPPLTRREHVHRPDQVDPADAPTLQDVSLEIVALQNWM